MALQQLSQGAKENVIDRNDVNMMEETQNHNGDFVSTLSSNKAMKSNANRLNSTAISGEHEPRNGNILFYSVHVFL